MSHDLEVIDGMAQAMFERVAWHRLGKVVGENFGWADAVSEGLAITLPVVKVPVADILTSVPLGDDLSGPTLRAQADDHATVRADGLVLATGLGRQLTVFPAVEGYAFGQAVREQVREVEGIRADLKSLGTIDSGRKWFMTFDLGEFSIGDYRLRDYISVNGSYDSSWTLQLLTSPVIEVCANTIAAARAAGVQHYRFKHTSGIFNRVEEAKIALARHAENRRLMKELGENLLQTRVTPTQYGQLVNALFPVTDETFSRTKAVNETAQEKVGLLYKGLTVGDGDQPVVSDSGNAWAFVQAVNSYENWGAPVRVAQGSTESQTRALRQVEALNSGVQKLTDKAFALAGALN